MTLSSAILRSLLYTFPTTHLAWGARPAPAQRRRVAIAPKYELQCVIDDCHPCTSSIFYWSKKLMA